MPGRLDIALQRNEDWSRTLFLADQDGLPVDLRGCSAAMQIRDKLSQTLIAEAEITIIDALNGEVGVFLRASEGSALAAYGVAIQTANLHYDFRLTDLDNVRVVLFSGLIILTRGETVT
jgi:hypothetical protein